MENTTKQKLLNTARDLIQRYGVNRMSYADLSGVVGISTASIHYYFPKKDDLILALIIESRTLYGDRFAQIAAGPGSAVEKIKSIVGLYYDGVCKDKMCFIGTLSAEVMSLSDGIRAALTETTEKNIRIFESIISQGMREGEFVQGKNSYEAAYAFNSAVLGAQIFSRCSGNPQLFIAAMDAFVSSISV
jgi:TetR/AcrR family transcriptional regulator, transcriptional repressor for nem operon